MEPAESKKFLYWALRKEKGALFMEDASSNHLDGMAQLHNLFACECFNCKGISIWVHDRLVSPLARLGAEPSGHLPEDVRRDFHEARGVVNVSPRSAAALLRLAIQKLCVAVGEKGKNIDAELLRLSQRG